MAILLLPNKNSTIPTVGQGLNPSHPLSNALKIAYPMTDPAHRLLDSNGLMHAAVTSPITIAKGHWNLGGRVIFSGTAQRFITPTLTSFLSGEFSWATWINRTATGTRLAWEWDAAGTQGATFYFDSGTGSMCFERASSATSLIVEHNDATANSLSTWLFFAGTYTSMTSAKLWVGTLNRFIGENTNTITSGTGTANAMSRLTVGNRQSSGFTWTGSIGATYFWDRLISPSEIEELWRDPYTMYQPNPKKLWVKGASGGSSQTLTLPLLTNTSTLYAPTIAPGAVNLIVPLLTNSNTLYSPTLTPGAVNLTTPLLTNANTFYSSILTPGAVNLTLPLLTNTNSLYAPTVTPGAVALTVPLLSNSNTLYPSALGLSVTLPLLTNSNTLYPPTVAPGAVGLTVPLLSNNSTLYAPTITTDEVTISPPLLTNNNTLYAQTLTPGAVNLTLPLLTNTSVLYSPELTLLLSLPLLTNSSVLYPPTVTPGSVALGLPFISNTNTLYPPTLIEADSLVLPLITSTNLLFSPTVTVGDVTITMPLLVNVSTLYAVTITPGAVEVSLPLLTGLSLLFAPNLQVGGVNLTMPLLGSGNVLYPPTLSFGQVLTLPLLTSASQFFNMQLGLGETQTIEGELITSPNPFTFVSEADGQPVMETSGIDGGLEGSMN